MNAFGAINRTFSQRSRTLQHKMIRRSLQFEREYPEDVEFSIARTPEDIKSASEILYDAYTDAGFMNADETGYRFTVYHALPYCYTLLAKQAGEVIATVTLIVRSRDKLPIENLLPIRPFLGFGRCIVEVSSLAIIPKARSKNLRIIFPLFKYLFTVAENKLGATDLVISCNPKHLAFYEAVLLFETISGETSQAYDLVDGAPAVAARLDLTTVPQRYAETFGKQPAHKNVYEYFIENEFPQFGIPKEKVSRYSGNNWMPDQLAWILKALANGRSELSGEDLRKLRAVYGSEYNDVFADLVQNFGPEARFPRVDLNMDASIARARTQEDARILAISDKELFVSAEKDPGKHNTRLHLQQGNDADDRSLLLGSSRCLGNDEYAFQIGALQRNAILAHCSNGLELC